MIDSSSHAGVQHFIHKMNMAELDREGVRGLVVGFGEGHEAEYLQHHTRAKIIGIDIRSRIPANQNPSFSPILASAMKLPFKESSFDFVFYHHVIEHVPNPMATLIEIFRLLVPNGTLYIGTPNRHRLIGYIGAYKISLLKKIKNNLSDYKYRLLGKFHNEMGAHAGFSKAELEKMLIPYFTDLQWLTEDYLIFKYRQRLNNSVLKILLKPYILEVVAPSIYVLCRKSAISETR
ncbi:MAG: class I SAM-dependent methyltransferase [Chloroflexi bacterium]|nr:MAG: class I SAM-dependent methyltransferase [Chloroflexota bacterium]